MTLLIGSTSPVLQVSRAITFESLVNINNYTNTRTLKHSTTHVLHYSRIQHFITPTLQHSNTAPLTYLITIASSTSSHQHYDTQTQHHSRTTLLQHPVIHHTNTTTLKHRTTHESRTTLHQHQAFHHTNTIQHSYTATRYYYMPAVTTPRLRVCMHGAVHATIGELVWIPLIGRPINRNQFAAHRCQHQQISVWVGSI